MEINGEEIKGIKGLYAFKALQTLLLSFYLLPEFKTEKESYDDFLRRFSDMPEEEKRSVLNKSLYFAGIDTKEIEALICFAKDTNGIPYGKHNINNLSIEQMFEIIVDVCLAVARIKVFF